MCALMVGVKNTMVTLWLEMLIRKEGSSMYYYIDENLEQTRGTGGDDGGYDLYTVYVATIDGYALSCVVCTK